MEERQRAITSARELAERSATRRGSRRLSSTQKTAEARAELYRQMDEMRRAALDERAAIMAAYARRSRSGNRRCVGEARRPRRRKRVAVSSPTPMHSAPRSPNASLAARHPDRFRSFHIPMTSRRRQVQIRLLRVTRARRRCCLAACCRDCSGRRRAAARSSCGASSDGREGAARTSRRWLQTVAKLANFAHPRRRARVLPARARSRRYLASRATAIRQDLVTAAEMRSDGDRAARRDRAEAASRCPPSSTRCKHAGRRGRRGGAGADRAGGRRRTRAAASSRRGARSRCGCGSRGAS